MSEMNPLRVCSAAGRSGKLKRLFMTIHAAPARPGEGSLGHPPFKSSCPPRARLS